MRALLLGPWKNVEDVEENLSLPEILALLKQDAQRAHDNRKFMAALKGIVIPDPEAEKVATFEEIKERAKRRALAERTGMSEEEVDLRMLGLDYEG